VTKQQPAQAVEAAIAAGMREFGENYVQEAQTKQTAITKGACRWHLIGHLQTNKANQAVAAFDLIQTVDSVRLAKAIGKAAAAIGKRQDILLQVKLGDEQTKTGLEREDWDAVISAVRSETSLRLVGLMGVAPLDCDPRPHFRHLKTRFDSLHASERMILSMGMTSDFEAAIEEGATMVRIGTAIFGARKSC
jgi:pyridoxal phosphate enzyme (YggS family)